MGILVLIIHYYYSLLNLLLCPKVLTVCQVGFLFLFRMSSLNQIPFCISKTYDTSRGLFTGGGERPPSEDNCMDVTWSRIPVELTGQDLELSHILGPALRKTGC